MFTLAFGFPSPSSATLRPRPSVSHPILLIMLILFKSFSSTFQIPIFSFQYPQNCGNINLRAIALSRRSLWRSWMPAGDFRSPLFDILQFLVWKTDRPLAPSWRPWPRPADFFCPPGAPAPTQSNPGHGRLDCSCAACRKGPKIVIPHRSLEQMVRDSKHNMRVTMRELNPTPARYPLATVSTVQSVIFVSRHRLINRRVIRVWEKRITAIADPSVILRSCLRRLAVPQADCAEITPFWMFFVGV